MRAVVYHGSTRRQNPPNLFGSNDIVLTTYETLRSEWAANGAIYSENWYRIILDEGEEHT